MKTLKNFSRLLFAIAVLFNSSEQINAELQYGFSGLGAEITYTYDPGGGNPRPEYGLNYSGTAFGNVHQVSSANTHYSLTGAAENSQPILINANGFVGAPS